ncbi:hypothetical protein RHGRI_004851 [Rhododendron griersonianum]|uniref:Uncharacterized protein n=1 Tax=Rhododendron griersonianum TaxID=479676 RepID=A0AAV6LCX3_9ERIC|nr:hypothetical protein RHGRI_004851 [Rhododendron griersonianum]
MRRFFCLRDDLNRTEIAAYIVDRGTGYTIYVASVPFLYRCSSWLPMGNIFEWYLEKDLFAWLDSVCYYSFLNSSVGGKSLVTVCLSDVVLNKI